MIFQLEQPKDEVASCPEGPDRAALAQCLGKLMGRGKGGPFSISGGVFAVSDRQARVSIVAAGVDAEGEPIREDSLLHFASASKLATGLLVLRLVDRGTLRLDAPIGDYLPDSGTADVPGVTIRRLLSHTAGMSLEVGHDLSSPPGNVRWSEGPRWPGMLADACLAAAPAIAPGTALQYSNIGYGLLGLAAERVAGRPFARLLHEEVLDPLHVEAYVDHRPDRQPIRVADVPSPFSGTPYEPYNSDTSRLLGAPWAGVTSNAQGLLVLVRAYLEDSSLISPDLAREAQRDQTGGVSGGFATTEPFLGHDPSRSMVWESCPWGLSIEVQGGKEPHWAPSTLPRSFGQIGSSGCLAWCDPASGVAWAVLGARTTDSGWLLRHGARIAETALRAAGAVPE